MPESLNLLLVKTSSLGDVIHNLPAVTDILRHYPQAQIDWVAEEGFAPLPALHPGIRSVIPIALRRWRKSWWASRHEVRASCRQLKLRDYDLILDSQGLLKSALVSRCAQGLRCGYDWASAREPIASMFYNKHFAVPQSMHAVERNRHLAAAALGYTVHGAPDYGIDSPAIVLPWLSSDRYVVFLHATSRDTKLWLEANWAELGQRLAENGFNIVLPWGSEIERQRSERLSAVIPNSICPPRLKLDQAASLLGRAQAVIGVDTGLNHLAAALHVPTIGIYTATDPGLTGLYAGDRAVNLGGKMQQPTVSSVLSELARLGLHV